MCARECVRDLAARRSSGSAFPPVLYFTLSTPESTRAFFGRLDPAASAIADPEKFFHAAFGLESGGLRHILSIGSFVSAVRALAKGNGVSRPDGDPLLPSGFFLVRGDRIVWRHVSRHVGDHPDWDAVARRAAGES